MPFDAAKQGRAGGAATIPRSTPPRLDRSGRPPLILAFGDSLIAGYGVEPSRSFTAILERELRVNRPGSCVLNAGVSGDTTRTGLERLPRVLDALPAKPDLSIVQLGANDLLGLVPLREIRANLDAIIAELRRADIPVLLATIEAPAFFGAFSRACARVYRDLAEKHGVLCASFFPKGVFASRRFCLADRLHPNAEGIDTIAKAFAPAVRSALARMADTAGRPSGGEVGRLPA